VAAEHPVVVAGIHQVLARPGQFRAQQHRRQPAGQEETRDGRQILDSDHFVIGVHDEIVPPAPGPVHGVVVRVDVPSARPAGPVVEAADPIAIPAPVATIARRHQYQTGVGSSPRTP
jgi:hypothetical protein